MVELVELFIGLAPLYLMLAGLYYKQGQADQKLTELYNQVEFQVAFKRKKR